MSARERRGRRCTYALMAIFVVYTVAIIVYQIGWGDLGLGLKGLMFPVFLLIPWLFRQIKLRPCWRLYCMLYCFIIFAFSYGCIWGVFRDGMIVDKVSHFVSGFVFTIVGFCLYYWQLSLQPQHPSDIHQGWGMAAGYALFFSMFIAAVWEVAEFFDFNVFGNDSQHHLTTGVFDTMYDLMACLSASLISVAAFALYRYKGVRGLTAFVVEEFYEKNVIKKEE